MSLEKKVLKTLRYYGLLSERDRVLVAFSGGPDSVVLVHLLIKFKDYLKIEDIAVAHLNHMLRKESVDDEKFCLEFASRYNLRAFIKRVDIASLSKKTKKSVEEAGREERYRFLREAASKEGYTKIATAHHLSDLAETMTLWFIQGSKRGLRGFRPKNDNIIRPLFLITKEEILQYCQERGLDFVIDISNLSEKYMRNKVRHRVIPVLKEINRSLETSLERMSYFLNLDEDYFEREVKKFFVSLDGDFIPFESIQGLDKALLYRIFQRWMESRELYISYQTLRQVLDYVENPFEKGYIKLPGGYKLSLRDNGFYIAEDDHLEKEGFSYKLKIGQRIFIPQAGCWIESFRMDRVDVESLKNERDLVCFDLEGEEFTVRSRMEGDRFTPFGKKSERKLKDIFIDMKVPKNKRNSIPLLVFGDKILWVCGYRRSALFLLDENSKNVVCFKLIKEV